MRICQWPILIAATLSILMVGCAEVPLLMDAAMMKSPGVPAVSKREGKGRGARDASDKEAETRKLVEITRADVYYEQASSRALQQIAYRIKEVKPDIPEKYYALIEQQTKSMVHDAVVREGGFIDMVAPVYGKHFTYEEIEGLLAHYESKLGEKVRRVSPTLNQEVGQAQEQWYRALVPLIEQRVFERLREEGLELKE